MNTFCQIIHKQHSYSSELYGFSNLEPTKDCNRDFFDTAWKYEYVPPVNTMTNTLLQMLLHIFAASSKQSTIKTKFDYFKTILDNMFVDSSTKKEFIDAVCSAQRKYRLISNLVVRYKWKRYNVLIKHDLILNPISDSQSNVITILQNNNKYFFTILDLKNIIDKSLMNSPYFFSEPLPIKNPYNNMPFGKSILYQIYFFIKTGNFVLSDLFHNYFLCNFNLKQFRDENEALIRKIYIRDYVKNAEIDALHTDILRMIKSSKYSRRIAIDSEFPKERLVEIMRPYLAIYYTFVYSLDMNARYNAESELNTKLSEFTNFNVKFGRKTIENRRSVRNRKTVFNDEHIPFSGFGYSKNYDKSHLEIDEDDDDGDGDSDSDSADSSISDYESDIIIRNNNSIQPVNDGVFVFTATITNIENIIGPMIGDLV